MLGGRARARARQLGPMEQSEPLVLKVMRLRRPQAKAPAVLTPLTGGLDGGCPDDAPKLLLPMSLTQSLVGEPFTGYLNLANVSAAPVSNVSLKVELQIGTSKFMLYNNTMNPMSAIEPGDFFDTDVEHDIRDAGTYVLTCTVAYSIQNALEPSSFKRSYRFPALQPFAVVHRVVQFDTRLLVECSVENATQGSIYLTFARLESKDGFEASLLDPTPSAASGIGGTTHLLKPRGAHSLVFSVVPKSDTVDVAYVRDQDSVGSLVLGWRVPDGPSGCVEGNTIKVKPCATPSLDLRVAACPKQVSVEVPFQVDVDVINRTGRSAEPSLVFDLRAMGSVKVHGATQHAVGKLEPYSSARVPLRLLVSTPGMHGLQGVSLLDELTHARCEFGVLCDILAF